MTIKRLFSSIVVLLMIFSCIPIASASEDAVNIDTASPEAYTGHINNGNPKDGMASNASVTYKFTAAQSGQYNLTIRAIVFGSGTAKADLGNLEVINCSIADTNSKTSVIGLGEFGIKEGENFLTLKFTGVEAVYLSSITLERIADYSARTEFVIKGSGCVETSVGVTGGNPETGMNVGAWAEYEIEIEKDGTYLIEAECAANEGQSPTLVLYANDVMFAEAAVTAEGWGTFTKTQSYETVFQKGKLTIKAEVKGNSSNDTLRIRRIYVYEKPLSPEEQFLADMKNASTVREVEEILVSGGGAFLTAYDSMTENVFYKNIVYERMLGLPYNSLEETDKYFTEIVETELREPIASVLQNGEEVTNISAGEFSVRIGARFDEQMTAIAAVYDNGALSDIVLEKIEPYTPKILSNLIAIENSELKIFFFEDFESVAPVKLPTAEEVLFVAESGSDSGDGSYDNPIQSFTEAAKRVEALNKAMPRNITVNFKSGEYTVTEPIVMNNENDGEDGRTVTYRSLSEDSPAVISGGVHVKGWESDGNGIYSVSVPELTDVRQLYVNGYPAQRAKSDYVYYAAARWDNSETKFEEDGFIVECDSFPQLSKPEDAEIVYNIMWTLQRLPVEDIIEDGDNRYVVKMDQAYYSEALTMICGGGVQPTVGQQFYIENDLSLLDSPGEFYFDKTDKKLYYYPFENEDMEKSEIVAGVTEQIISASGNSQTEKLQNITFENLSFRYGAYTEVNEKGTCVFQAECLTETADGGFLNQNPVSVGRSLGAQLEFTNAQNISFKDCDISCMGGTALRFGRGVSNSKITGCVFRDNGGSAISVGEWKNKDASSAEELSDNIIVENNVITRCGLDFMGCPAISAYYGKDFTIRHNDISDTPYSGISLGWGWESSTPEKLGCGGHVIEENKIGNTSKAVRDGGHIYLLGAMSDVVVQNNYLYSSDDYGGIYFDTGSSGTTVLENVIEDCRYWLFGGYESKDITVLENYTDSTEKKFSPPENSSCTLTEETVFENGSWSGKALDIVNSAGVREEYEEGLQAAELPQWRKELPFNIPVNEAVDKDDFLVEAENYSNYYVEAESKEMPSVYQQGTRYVVGDIRMNDWFEYSFDVPQDGIYTVELRYTTGPDTDNKPKVKLYVNKETMTNADFEATLSCTKTEWSAYLPYTFGTVSLKSGTNTIILESASYSFSMDALKFIKSE